MKARFDELLPFYVNGTLTDTDRAWVDDYLRDNPEAGAELQWCRSLQGRLRDDVPPVSSEVGLELAMRRIRAERPQAAVRRPAAPSLVDRLRDFFASITPQPVLRPALAGALAVVLVQALVIGSLVGTPDESSELRAVRPSVIDDKGPYLKLNFKADAREADIRLLLVEVNGSLAGGPGQLGDWYVHVPAPQLAAVTDRLKSSDIVEAVAVVDALPARR
jgi:hypothetical protein